MLIRPSIDADVPDLRTLEVAAFGVGEGPIIADLVVDSLNDPTAQPLLSLVAVEDKQIIGHILFTRAEVAGAERSVSASILAPLAVRPSRQNQGIGGLLINEGLGRLEARGAELVFVLGHPSYYPRFGFRAAHVFGLEAPYPLPGEHADAWMVLELRPKTIGRIKGKLRCSDTLSRLQYWSA